MFCPLLESLMWPGSNLIVDAHLIVQSIGNLSWNHAWHFVRNQNVILTRALILTILSSAEIWVRTHLTLNHSRPGWMRLQQPSRHCETSLPISNFACNYWLHWYLARMLELDVDFKSLCKIGVCRHFENGNLAGQLPQDLLSYPNLQGLWVSQLLLVSNSEPYFPRLSVHEIKIWNMSVLTSHPNLSNKSTNSSQNADWRAIMW